MVPQSPLVGFNSSAVGRRLREHASWQLRSVALFRGGRTFGEWSATTGSPAVRSIRGR
jgi:hypothetical protein